MSVLLGSRRRNRRATFLILTLIAVLSSVPASSCSAGVGTGGDFPASGTTPREKEGRGRYIVRLVDAPLAGYPGGAPGSAPTHPGVTGKPLDIKSPAAQAYLAFLSKKRSQFKEKAELLLGRAVVFDHQFEVTLNAVTMTMTPVEASRVAALPEVAGIEPDRRLELHPASPGDLKRSLE
ncbi:MAG: hypothetical protein V1816_13255 [Pseudomonadota bacterium]